MAELAKLRVGIDGRWTSEDFARLFSEMELLNECGHFAYVRVDEQSDGPYYLFRRRVRDREWLWPLDPEEEVEVEGFIHDVAIRSYIRYFVRPTRLEVSAIRFESPGFVDLLGVGKVIEQVRKFVVDITDRYLAVEDRELEREHKRQRIFKDKLANAEKLLKIAEKSGMDEESRRQMLRRLMAADLYIEEKIIDGEITSVEQIDPQQ